MRQPPILDQRSGTSDDEEAEYQAALARRHASEMVRDHLETHAANNPGASSDYVTWVATLHPENASIVIDQRFFIPGNPWWTIYEETKNNQTIPTATAVAISQEDEESQQQDHPSSPSQRKDDTSVFGHTRPSFCMTCSPITLFAGFMVSSQALLGVLLCEFCAFFLCHLPAALFFHIASAFSPPNVFTGVLYSFCMVLYCCFALCDSIVLLLSVLVTEVLAVTAFLVCAFTGGIIWGQFWHQQVRRMCHGVRIIFRRKASGNPPRHFLFWSKQCEDTMEQQNRIAEVVSVPVQYVRHQPARESVEAIPVDGIATKVSTTTTTKN
ncbi:hypothetical protein IV203_004332 [Nitzschia inconspicua]|uniref:Uncharacterized protein n=1 Tax=Nitzschia inconspicua TaxID=303405 RepID=A0A9K3L560_9STRA|nr:hypothetical protein IV203_004332 [Nitzschia inconspicua]